MNQRQRRKVEKKRRVSLERQMGALAEPPARKPGARQPRSEKRFLKRQRVATLAAPTAAPRVTSRPAEATAGTRGHARTSSS